MAAELNHTIVRCRDKARSSSFLAEMLGLPGLERANGGSLDFTHKAGATAPQHYAFLVDDARFDAGLALIRARGIPHWAEPARRRAGEINRHDGGRGVYFADPDDHLLELITTPYGTEKPA